jgi:hypothetical protein
MGCLISSWPFRERKITRYTPEKTDPRDADLISFLPPQGKFLETRLSSSTERETLAQRGSAPRRALLTCRPV